VQLAHGGGGTLMHKLIGQAFLPAFDNPMLAAAHDGATLDSEGRRIAFSTDSYVVHPLFFPGGDIGSLAVNGTVNDLAMCGARPRYLSAGFIIEEGLAMTDLWRIVVSMKEAANAVGVAIVTGDTKVVDRGKGDGIFINTAGIGTVEHDRVIGPAAIEPGDVVLLSGDIGRHGIAIMAVREGLEFESEIQSDCAPIVKPVLGMLAEGVRVHCLRDLTRGGLASALVEIAEASGRRIALDGTTIPVTDTVRGACEMLGFDPMYVANEGRYIAIVPPGDADSALAQMAAHGTNPVCIGEVTDRGDGLVTITSSIGATRIVDMLSGEQLPRIC
jgi:hydrogenase expression/formation protein HypE